MSTESSSRTETYIQYASMTLEAAEALQKMVDRVIGLNAPPPVKVKKERIADFVLHNLHILSIEKIHQFRDFADELIKKDEERKNSRDAKLVHAIGVLRGNKTGLGSFLS